MNSSKLITTAYNKQQYPRQKTPEIAVCGRSNCGKSTLINALLKRKKAAHVSSKPGKTISINFYKAEEHLNIVDLPGYGYAKVPLKMKEQWKTLIEDYLTNRQQLKMVFLLIDCRRSIEEDEISFINWLYYNKIPFIICITKIDKLNRNELSRKKTELLAHLDNLWQDSEIDIYYLSITKNIGIDKIKSLLKGIR